MKAWSLFSGGKDSIATAYYLASKGDLAGVVYFDTQIRAPEQLDYVSDVAKKFDWPLIVERTPVSFEKIVREEGWARPWNHNIYMNYLKGRCMRRLPKNQVYASGVRKKESRRRLGHAKPVSEWEGRVLTAPLIDWSTPQVWDYIHKYDLPISPCSQLLGPSGDCFCGSHAATEERPLTARFYPSVMKMLNDLERRYGGYWAMPQCKLRKYDSDKSLLCFDGKWCGSSSDSDRRPMTDSCGEER